MALYPDTLTELSDNVFFWLLAADKYVSPRLLEMPPSRVRREVIEQHEDLYGHLHAFLAILPHTEAQQGPVEEPTLTDFLRSISDLSDFLEAKEARTRGGLKPPVAINTWKFLQSFYLAAGGQAAIFICDLNDPLDSVLHEPASEVARGIMHSWRVINLTLAEVTGVEFSAEMEDPDNEI